MRFEKNVNMDKFLEMVSRESPELYSHMVDENGQLTFLGVLAYLELGFAVAREIGRVAIEFPRKDISECDING